jgi:hypothetical protein
MESFCIGMGGMWIDVGWEWGGEGAFTLSLSSLSLPFPQFSVDATKDHKPKISKWQLPNLW